MWLIKLPFKLLALPVLLVVCVFTIFYKLALGVTGFAAGIIYLIFGVCIVIALLQGYWVHVGIVFAAACVVFLITMTAELVLMGLEALSGLLSGFILFRGSRGTRKISPAFLCPEEGGVKWQRQD